MKKILNETVVITYYKHVEHFGCCLFQAHKNQQILTRPKLGGTLSFRDLIMWERNLLIFV